MIHKSQSSSNLYSQSLFLPYPLEGLREDDYIEGAPELVVEIAASSASYDLHAKLNMYRRNGVQEYLVWQMYEDEFFWYRLEKGQYVVTVPDEQGLIKSQIFPGLVLDVPALLARDLATVLAQLQRAIGAGSHQDFVARLNLDSKGKANG